jgi:hypothetical protein
MEVLRHKHHHCLFVRIFFSNKILFRILYLIDLINMILLSYPDEPESSRTFYSGQKGLQTVLIIVAVLCIPWMLLGKPIYRIMMNKRRANVSYLINRFFS